MPASLLMRGPRAGDEATVMPAQPAPERYPLFDVTRLLAALMVIFSHAFTTTGVHEPQPIHFGRLGVTWGHIGVAIFFVTSGYLVTQSWRRQPNGLRYLAKRALRIWPGFLVVIGLSVFVLGPIATTWSRRAYITDYHTWGYLFHNAAMSPITFNLPGVFRHQPLNGINGSFWTLPYEVGAYLALFALGVTRMLRWWILGALAGATLVVYQLGIATRTIGMWDTWNGLLVQNMVRLGVWFVLGALLAEGRRFVIGRHRSAAVALVVAVIGVLTHQEMLAIPALAFLVIYVGTLPFRPAELLHRLGDPSYGMYLYGFVIQQTLMWSGLVHRDQPWLSFVEATVLAVIFGYASWHLVESRALRLLPPKRRHDEADRAPDSGDFAEPVEDVAHPLALRA
jgi:peptidoglycan/LPS O-acetylase OafA/YrhL